MSTDSNLPNLGRRTISSFDYCQPDDGLELAADANTEVPTNLVCCRSIRNVTNCLYFQSMFRSMNWNVQQIDWFVRNCNRSVAVIDAIGWFALADAGVAAVAVARIKDPKKCLMNP